MAKNYIATRQHNFKASGDGSSNYPGRTQAILNDRGLLTFPRHIILEETFKKRPALNAVKDLGTPTNAQVIAADIANDDFEVLGTNMTTALATYATHGGVTLTTAGASADQAILLPHLNTNQTAWSAIQWNTGKMVRWEGFIMTDASIAAMILWAGLKLTNTPVVATDDNQVFFRYEAGVNDGQWQVISSRAGVDTTTNLGKGFAVAANTLYRLVIAVNENRYVECWINGVRCFTAPLPALTDNINLIPYMGIQASAVAAKAFTAKFLRLSRLAA